MILHPQKPLFAMGGLNNRVELWDFAERRLT